MLKSIQINNTLNPNIEFNTELDGTRYFFIFRFNYRLARWFMSVSESDNDILVSGVLVRSNFPLLKTYSNPLLPQGDLVVVNLLENFTDPTFEGFGKDYVLTYEAEDEAI